MITDVDELLPLLQRGLAHGREGEHGLELGAVPCPQGREAQLAGVALEDHSAGDAHAIPRGHIDVEIWIRRAHLSDGVRHGEADGVGLATTGEQAIALISAHAHLLWQILRGILRVVVGHVRKGSQPVFFSNTRRRPTRVRSGSWWVMVSDSGTTMGASPPVAITAWTPPSSSLMRRTSPSTWPAKP